MEMVGQLLMCRLLLWLENTTAAPVFSLSLFLSRARTMAETVNRGFHFQREFGVSLALEAKLMRSALRRCSFESALACSDFHHFHIVAPTQLAIVFPLLRINLDVCVNLLVSVSVSVLNILQLLSCSNTESRWFKNGRQNVYNSSDWTRAKQSTLVCPLNNNNKSTLNELNLSSNFAILILI